MQVAKCSNDEIVVRKRMLITRKSVRILQRSLCNKSLMSNVDKWDEQNQQLTNFFCDKVFSWDMKRSA